MHLQCCCCSAVCCVPLRCSCTSSTTSEQGPFIESPKKSVLRMGTAEIQIGSADLTRPECSGTWHDTHNETDPRRRRFCLKSEKGRVRVGGKVDLLAGGNSGEGYCQVQDVERSRSQRSRSQWLKSQEPRSGLNEFPSVSQVVLSLSHGIGNGP